MHPGTRPQRSLDRTLGVAVWIGFAVAGVVLWQSRGAGTSPADVPLRHAWTTTTIDVDARGMVVPDRTPVFARVDSRWTQIGWADETGRDSLVRISLAGELLRHDDASPLRNWQFHHHHSDGSFAETLATMLPPDRQRQIAERLQRWSEQHGRAVADQMWPVVRQAIVDVVPAVERELRISIENHRQEWQSLAQRTLDGPVENRLMPVARKRVLPLARKHGEGPAREIGRELWDRASIWRFTWRAIYDRSPLPRQDLLAEEWDRFVDDEAIPVFESHAGELATVAGRILAEVIADEDIREQFGLAIEEIAADPQTQSLVRTTIREALIENDRVRSSLRQAFASPQAIAAMDDLSQATEPLVRSIGDDLFGTREQGITPEFARVLRRQILGRDRVWIVAGPPEPNQSTSDPIRANPRLIAGPEGLPFPVVHLADAS